MQGLNMEESQACGHMRVVSEHVAAELKIEGISMK